MNLNSMNPNFYKFPSALREKLLKGELVFPQGIAFKYPRFPAFRIVLREKGDNTKVSDKDFRSYFELGKKPRGTPFDYKSVPEYYAVSLFLNRKKAEQALKLPRPGKRIAEGFVEDIFGPQLTNVKTQHVSWWLYENSEINSFKLEV